MNKHHCKLCKQEFEKTVHNKKYCSKKCKTKQINLLWAKKMVKCTACREFRKLKAKNLCTSCYNRKNSFKKNQENINKDNFVECLICNQKMMLLQKNHLKTHNLTKEDYIKKHPNAEFKRFELNFEKEARINPKKHSKSCSDRMKKRIKENPDLMRDIGKKAYEKCPDLRNIISKRQRQYHKDNPEHASNMGKRTQQLHPNLSKKTMEKTIEKYPDLPKRAYKANIKKNPDLPKRAYKAAIEKYPDLPKRAQKAAIEKYPDLPKRAYKANIKKNPDLHKRMGRASFQKNPNQMSKNIKKWHKNMKEKYPAKYILKQRTAAFASVEKQKVYGFTSAPEQTAANWILEKYPDFLHNIRLGGIGVPDFHSKSRKLIIEVDSIYWHQEHNGGRLEGDKLKDKEWGKMGYKVLRIDEKKIRKTPQEAKLIILNWIEKDKENPSRN